MKSGDLEKAERMFDKSLRLFHDPAVAALLARVRERRSGSSSSSSSSSGSESHGTPSQRGAAASATGSSDAGLRHRRHATAAPAASPASSPVAPPAERVHNRSNFSDEAWAEVEVITRARTHYEVLSLQLAASEGDIKKAYRKKAVLVHPDKCNNDPKADEAFKKVGTAYAILSDEDKRAAYNATELDAAGRPIPRAQVEARQARQHAAYEQEIRPEDIFNAFFGGPMGMGGAMGPGSPFMGGRVYRNGHATYVRFGGGHPQAQQHRRRGDDDDGGGNGGGGLSLHSLLNLLPLLMLLLFSMTQLGGRSESVYSLSHDLERGFTQKMTTQMGKFDLTPNVPYFIRPNSDVARRMDYDGHFRLRLEREVDREAVNHYYRGCEQEKVTKQRIKRHLASRLTESQQKRLSGELVAMEKRDADATSSCAVYNTLYLEPRRQQQQQQQQQQGRR